MDCAVVANRDEDTFLNFPHGISFRPAQRGPATRLVSFLFLALRLIASHNSIAQESAFHPQPSSSIWAGDGQPGFRKGAQELDLSLGAGFGMAVITSIRTHDWALGSLQYGWICSQPVALDHWWRGNWELLGQIFGGEQFYPSRAYFVGGGPLIRYDFAPSRRVVPFVDFGGGVSATDIRDGDLSTTFEFNLQAGAGAHFFLRDNVALTFQYRFIHMSNAGIKFPNLGLNNSTFLLGVTWFF
jgi:lipid A 3-O-deacylase